MSQISLLFQVVISGVLMGAVYALLALGLTLVTGVLNIVNFSHGSLMMLGMFTSYWLFHLAGVDPYLSLPASFVILFLIGALIQRFLMEPLIGHPHTVQLLVSLGLVLVIETIILAMWGSDSRTIRLDYERSIELAGAMIGLTRILAFIGAMIMALALYKFLHRTRLGIAVRAAADHKEAAMLMGVNVKRIYILVFGLGCACAGVAGSLILPFYHVEPFVGHSFLLIAFIVMVMGGMGSFAGAMVGGAIIGIVESLGTVYLPGSMALAVIFLVFIAVLLFRPQGLFRA